MLNRGDIGRLFAIMKASYGHLWRQSAEDAEVWLRRLGGFDPQQVTRAAETATDFYPDGPPSLGQFVAVIKSAQPATTTYLPAPERRHVDRFANRVLLRVLTETGGVDRKTMKNLVDFKNALVEDHGAHRADEQFVESLGQELSTMARGCDQRARSQELAIAEERFRVRCGMSSQVP